jgi:hypothetical protein
MNEFSSLECQRIGCLTLGKDVITESETTEEWLDLNTLQPLLKSVRHRSLGETFRKNMTSILILVVTYLF